MQTIDVIKILQDYIILIISLAATFISSYAAFRSRKFAALLKNALDRVMSIGEVVAAIEDAWECLREIEESIQFQSPNQRESAMKRKSEQTKILISSHGACLVHSNTVLKLGKMLKTLDTDTQNDFDAAGHAMFYIESGALMDNLKGLMETLQTASEEQEIPKHDNH